jgi:hypothetical protein
MHTLHCISGAALRRALILSLCGAGLAGCVTVTTSSGTARSANEPTRAQPARSLSTQGQGGGGTAARQVPTAPVAAASQKPATAYTRESLANVYGTHNEHDFGFELLLRQDGSSRMTVPNGEEVNRFNGRWRLQGDRITVEQKVGKKNDRLVYVVREALKPAHWSGAGCKGSFGLEALSVGEGEDRTDFFVWPKQALMAEQAPCRK